MTIICVKGVKGQGVGGCTIYLCSLVHYTKLLTRFHHYHGISV